MKKQFTFFIWMILMISVKLTAQTNWILGRQNVGGNTSIGSLDAYRVDFLTGGTPRFTVLSSGNMGVGGRYIFYDTEIDFEKIA